MWSKLYRPINWSGISSGAKFWCSIVCFFVSASFDIVSLPHHRFPSVASQQFLLEDTALFVFKILFYLIHFIMHLSYLHPLLFFYFVLPINQTCCLTSLRSKMVPRFYLICNGTLDLWQWFINYLNWININGYCYSESHFGVIVRVQSWRCFKLLLSSINVKYVRPWNARMWYLIGLVSIGLKQIFYILHKEKIRKLIHVRFHWGKIITMQHVILIS